MGFKALMSSPLALLVLAAAIEGRSPETHLLWWAILGSGAGAYASAAWLLLPALLGAELPPYWRAVAALRVSISFVIGLFLNLGIVSQYGLHWHHWIVAALSFVLALSGLALKPVIDRIVTQQARKHGGGQ